MTIHSDWPRILHEECPQAFVARPLPPGQFDVGVIDGHLQLMCLHSGFQSWDAFIMAVFVRPIQRLYAAGCPTVVLCFDSYANVPAYKAMTQQKRATPHKVCVFGPDQALPTEIPDDTMVHLMNRHFKLQVIQLACERVPPLVCSTLLAADTSRRFIVDYKCAVEYTHDTPHTPAPLSDLVPLGESDIKFTRYVERYGSALVHAVDGDYMAIALLYYAACGLREDNRIFLYRILSRLRGGVNDNNEEEEETTTTKKKNGGGGGKRKQPLQHPSTTTTAAGRPAKCWVDMQLLFAVVARSVWQSHSTGGRPDARPLNPRTREPFTDADAVYSAVCLMLCAGTDFSRAMPLLGPKRLWEALPLVVDAMLLAASGSLSGSTPQQQQQLLMDGPLDVDLFGAHVLATIYASVFAKHVGAPPSSSATGAAQPLAYVMHRLRAAPRLANSTTKRLPTPAQVRVTLQNIGWVVQYWLAYNSRVPSPLDGRHGFTRCPRTSAITFADLVRSDAAAEDGA